jgi:hypothetical protein
LDVAGERVVSMAGVVVEEVGFLGGYDLTPRPMLAKWRRWR